MVFGGVEELGSEKVQSWQHRLPGLSGREGSVTLAALRADRIDLKRGPFRWGQDPELTVKARTQ